MKTLVQLTVCFCLFLLSGNISAQVTKLSNNTNLQFAITLGNKALLKTRQDSIWVTDGTHGGTFKLRDDVATTGEAIVYKNKIYFGGVTASRGAELWVSDCTVPGTKRFKDINYGSASSSPTNFYVFNNTLFFFAFTADNGYELWKSDGSFSGTVMVKDIYQGKGSSYDPISSTFFYATNGLLFFEANDSTHGKELWVTDGSGGGTTLVKDISPTTYPYEITTFNSLNNKFIFSGKGDYARGIKLWSTDGTSGGTTVIKTLEPYTNNYNFSAQSLSRFENKLVFALEGFVVHWPAIQPINQLYATNAAGTDTKLLKNLGHSTLSFSYGTLTPTITNKFYFMTYTKKGNSLWESDGTAAGTKITKAIGNTLNINGAKIPIIITDFYTSTPDSVNTKTFNGKFFIAVDDSTHGYEPWITDGTSNGTKLVKDIYKGSGSSLLPSLFTYIYSKQGLYFAANDNKTGAELWLSDGTAVGTAEVADIKPGEKSSNPVFVGIVNSHLLIAADDGDNASGNTDLYKIDATFDTLRKANTPDAVKVNIAPDGTSFSVYPNPAKNQLNVRLDKNLTSQHVSFLITNQKGQELYSKEINGMQLSSTYQIDISRFAQGTYYFGVRTDKGISSTTFIKVN